MLKQHELRKLLPQRYPLLLVDAIVELEPTKSVTAIKCITCNEPCYQGVEDSERVEAYAYPESLIIESFSQSVAPLLQGVWEAKGNSSEHVVMFGSMSKITFLESVFPGDTLRHHAELGYHDANTAMISSLAINLGIKLLKIDIPYRIDAGAIALLVSLTVFFGISLLSKPPRLDSDVEAVMDL